MAEQTVQKEKINTDIKVSVIIPVYNTEKFLNRCLDSVIEQTYVEYEVICIDDCSTDRSRDILNRYEESSNGQIRVLYNEHNIGQGRSRMKGLSAAKGEYVMFVDSDDYVASDYIQRYVNAAEGTSCDIVVGGFIRDANGRQSIYEADHNIWAMISYSHACCKMYRKKFIIEHNIDFGSFRKGEDIYFSLLLVLCKARHFFVNYCGYYYYENKHSTTRTMKSDSGFEIVISEIFDEIIKKRRRYNPDSMSEKYLEYAYVAGMVNAIITYGHGCGLREMNRKYDFFLNDMKRKFKYYEENKALYEWHSDGASLKCRLGVWVVMNAIKMGSGRVVFGIIGCV